MGGRKAISALVVLAALLAGCATRGDIRRLESKIDTVVRATERQALQEIFGTYTSVISERIDELDVVDARRFEDLQQSYEEGGLTLLDTRDRMLSILGGNDREVATERGIYVRNDAGAKVKAIPRGTKILDCRRVMQNELPGPILEKDALRKYAWGRGRVDGTPVLFPWELTLSAFTKEIVENTAERTAARFIEMGGAPEWNRPIHIHISTEKGTELTVKSPEENAEIFFFPEGGAEKERPAGPESRP